MKVNIPYRYIGPNKCLGEESLFPDNCFVAIFNFREIRTRSAKNHQTIIVGLQKKADQPAAPLPFSLSSKKDVGKEGSVPGLFFWK